MMKRWVLIAALTAAAVIAPATAQNQAMPSKQQQPCIVSVEMTDDLRYVPETVTIRAGDTVQWTNKSRTAHTVTLDPRLARDPKNVQMPINAEPFNSGDIAPGGTWTHRFTLPGRYRYFCIPHEGQAMVGEIVVGNIREG